MKRYRQKESDEQDDSAFNFDLLRMQQEAAAKQRELTERQHKREPQELPDTYPSFFQQEQHPDYSQPMTSQPQHIHYPHGRRQQLSHSSHFQEPGQPQEWHTFGQANSRYGQSQLQDMGWSLQQASNTYPAGSGEQQRLSPLKNFAVGDESPILRRPDANNMFQPSQSFALSNVGSMSSGLIDSLSTRTQRNQSIAPIFGSNPSTSSGIFQGEGTQDTEDLSTHSLSSAHGQQQPQMQAMPGTHSERFAMPTAAAEESSKRNSKMTKLEFLTEHASAFLSGQKSMYDKHASSTISFIEKGKQPEPPWFQSQDTPISPSRSNPLGRPSPADQAQRRAELLAEHRQSFSAWSESMEKLNEFNWEEFIEPSSKPSGTAADDSQKPSSSYINQEKAIQRQRTRINAAKAAMEAGLLPFGNPTAYAQGYSNAGMASLTMRQTHQPTQGKDSKERASTPKASRVGSATSASPSTASAGDGSAAFESSIDQAFYKDQQQSSLKNEKKRKKKDMPKRPLSAYNIFFKEERQRILQDTSSPPDEDEDPADPTKKRRRRPPRRDRKIPHYKIDFATLGKKISKRWKELSPEELAPYKAEANREKERYNREMAEYRAKYNPKDTP